MTQRLDFRIDEKTQENLNNLIAKSGHNKTEIMTTLINNATVANFKMIDAKKDREIELLAVKKYLSFLFKNATTNLNQLSKNVNTAKINEIDKNEVKQAMNDLRKSVEELTKSIKEKDMQKLEEEAKKKKEELANDKQSN